MSTNFLKIETKVPLHLERKFCGDTPIHKTPQEIDVQISTLAHINKITLDTEMKSYYRGALMALLWARHPLSVPQASKLSLAVAKGECDV